MTKNLVVVIGSGVSGLTSLKTCLENDLDVVCFEKTDNYGGLWRFRTEVIRGVGSVQRSTQMNTTKETSGFSDFPPDSMYPNFMSNSQYIEYLDSYVRHFGLEKHIRFGHEVTSLNPAPDYDETGNWVVRVRNMGGITFDLVASNILVGVGHHGYPTIPLIPGLSTFTGRVLHSHQYKDFKDFEGLRVLVVGTGNSALDVADDLQHAARKVYISTRRGTWILPRMGPDGLPFEYAVNKVTNMLQALTPTLYSKIMEHMLNQRFNHALYNMKPSHGILSHHLTINDSLPVNLLCGTVVLKGAVEKFSSKGVVFQGEMNDEYPIDAVVLGTGYDFHLPILNDIVSFGERGPHLYARMFPPEWKHATLAVIGFFNGNGSHMPICELQARWACQIFKRKKHIPSKAEMWKEIHAFDKFLKGRYLHSESNAIMVNAAAYSNMLASYVGCKPNLWKILFTDIVLFRHLMLGPMVAYQFRLQGPNSWHGARNAILTVMERTLAPMKTRKTIKSFTKTDNRTGTCYLFIGVGLTAIVGAAIYFKDRLGISLSVNKDWWKLATN